MEQQQSQPVPQVPVSKLTLPNSTEALILGICSIPTCCCLGIFGMAAGIIAIVLGNKAIKLYKENPGLYSPGSYENANAGMICGIIGTALAAIYIIYWVVYIVILVFYGTMIATMPGMNW